MTTTASPHSVGDRVRFVPGPFDRNIPDGVHTITRVMPRERDGVSYRARSVADGVERVLHESQLVSARTAIG